MVHSEFIKNYKEHKISISIDRTKSLLLVEQGYLGKSYYISQILFSWLWILGIIGGIFLYIFYTWWASLISIIIGLGLPGAIKMTAMQGVRDKLLEDSEFYEYAKQNNIFIINTQSFFSNPL
jgi:hypothetical protein